MLKHRIVPFPETGFVRLHQIIGNPKADPPIPAYIPVSKSTWWNGVKDGRFPQPVKFGPRTTAWRAEDVRRIESFAQPQIQSQANPLLSASHHQGNQQEVSNECQ